MRNIKEVNWIERQPLNCRDVPKIIQLVSQQTGKRGYLKGCTRECHNCYRDRCA